MDSRSAIEKIIRVWRDPKYRGSLSSEELRSLPQSPVGFLDLNEEEQSNVTGGTSMPVLCTSIPSICVRSTICGTCADFTAGCC